MQLSVRPPLSIAYHVQRKFFQKNYHSKGKRADLFYRRRDNHSICGCMGPQRDMYSIRTLSHMQRRKCERMRTHASCQTEPFRGHGVFQIANVWMNHNRGSFRWWWTSVSSRLGYPSPEEKHVKMTTQELQRLHSSASELQYNSDYQNLLHVIDVYHITFHSIYDPWINTTHKHQCNVPYKSGFHHNIGTKRLPSEKSVLDISHITNTGSGQTTILHIHCAADITRVPHPERSTPTSQQDGDNHCDAEQEVCVCVCIPLWLPVRCSRIQCIKYSCFTIYCFFHTCKFFFASSGK